MVSSDGASVASIASTHLITWPAASGSMVVEPPRWTTSHIVIQVKQCVVHIGTAPSSFLTLLTNHVDASLVALVLIPHGFWQVVPGGHTGSSIRIVEFLGRTATSNPNAGPTSMGVTNR